jgi:soluble lytic murein transglycosylase-like protein
MKGWVPLLLSTTLVSVAGAQEAPASRAVQAKAAPVSPNVPTAPADHGWRPYDQCFTAAAERFGVDKHMLIAIAKTESAFNPHAIGPTNADGTHDVGLMQINTRWLPQLAHMGIHREKLMGACTNIYVGAWILSKKIRQHGTLWKAVGAYNAITPDKRARYVAKVQRNYARVRALLVNS